MIVDRLRGRSVLIRHRNPATLERVETRINDVMPYCFVETQYADMVSCIAKEQGYVGVYGEALTKCIFPDPSDVGKLKGSFKTWEANIPFVNRVLCDKKSNFPNYKHRVWYLDMEWSMETGTITAITVYDNYTERLFTWFLCNDSWPLAGPVSSMPCKDHPDGLDTVEFDTPAIAFMTEQQMLQHFVNHLIKHDPDVITGWFVVGADIRVLAERLDYWDIGAKTLSPLNRHRYEYKDDWSQPIPGRLCIDLMVAWSKLWQLKNGKLPNLKLDTAAYEGLNERKIPLPEGHDTYYSDIGTYIHYNRVDVELMPRLNSLNNAIEHFLAVQHLVQCDIRTTPFVTKIFSLLAMRDPEFEYRIPSRPQFDKVDYEGADIMEPEPDIYENIGIFDVRAMYHSNVAKYGISWETIDADGDDIGNGLCFNRSKTGVLQRQMDMMTNLRNEYKAKMKQAKTDEERRRYDSLQYATKSLVASMYGVCGDSKYGLYHPDVAAAITFTSRRTLGELKDHCEERGCEVIYGHTDSVFVRVPDPEQGLSMITEINGLMKPIITEFEKWCSSMLIVAKNRYACRVSWTDGEHHEPQTYIKGIEMKQSRMPQVMKDAMENVIDGLLDGYSPQYITNITTRLIEDVMSGDRHWEDLCLRGKLERDLSEYKVLSESRAAADWANRTLGKDYRAGSSFYVCLDESGKYIAFDDVSELEGHATIGYRDIAERFICKKIEPYFNMMGEDPIVLSNAINGLGGMEWL